MKICILGSFGKALVMKTDRIPIEGETLLSYDFYQAFGGKGSDMAVQAARLGADVYYLGVVGDDAYGKEFIELMNTEKINTEGLRISNEQPTCIGFVIKDKKGHNIIVVNTGANALLNDADIDIALPLIKQSSVVLAQLEIPLSTALYGLNKAKIHGKTTILNPAPAVKLSDADLSFVDILTPNKTEALIAVGASPDSDISNKEVAEELLKTGCNTVVMTLGADGAAVFSKSSSFVVNPYHVKSVDSNGAGDSFNAALAVALAEGQHINKAVRYANAVAALCCTKWETVPSYHKHEEVMLFLENNGGL